MWTICWSNILCLGDRGCWQALHPALGNAYTHNDPSSRPEQLKAGQKVQKLEVGAQRVPRARLLVPDQTILWDAVLYKVCSPFSLPLASRDMYSVPSHQERLFKLFSDMKISTFELDFDEYLHKKPYTSHWTVIMIFQRMIYLNIFKTTLHCFLKFCRQMVEQDILEYLECDHNILEQYRQSSYCIVSSNCIGRYWEGILGRMKDEICRDPLDPIHNNNPTQKKKKK